jgi:hypothetical protein
LDLVAATCRTWKLSVTPLDFSFLTAAGLWSPFSLNLSKYVGIILNF